MARGRIETLGVSFKPVPELVLKADYQNYDRNNDESSFGSGPGYMFCSPRAESCRYMCCNPLVVVSGRRTSLRQYPASDYAALYPGGKVLRSRAMAVLMYSWELMSSCRTRDMSAMSLP